MAVFCLRCDLQVFFLSLPLATSRIYPPFWRSISLSHIYFLSYWGIRYLSAYHVLSLLLTLGTIPAFPSGAMNSLWHGFMGFESLFSGQSFLSLFSLSLPLSVLCLAVWVSVCLYKRLLKQHSRRVYFLVTHLACRALPA